MKRIFIVIVAITALLGACSKKKGPAPVHSVQQNNNLDTGITMDAKISGIDWHTDSVFAYRVQYSGDSGKMDLYITATNISSDTPSTIAFTITNYTGVNNYAVSPPFVSATYYRGNERHYGTVGSINITTDGPYAIIGSFNFTADTIIISQGSFNVAKP